MFPEIGALLAYAAVGQAVSLVQNWSGLLDSLQASNPPPSRFRRATPLLEGGFFDSLNRRRRWLGILFT